MRTVALSFVTSALAMQARGHQRPFTSELMEEESFTPTSYGLELTNGNNVMYTALVGIGTPAQEAKIIFDTGSSHFWVNSNFCKNRVCKAKTQFNHMKSSSFLQSDRRSRDVVYGSGYVRLIYGVDHISMGGKALPFPELVGLAYDMDPNAFEDLPNDGIIGLGPIHGLSQNEAPESLLYMLKQSNALKQNVFSVYLSPGNPNSIESKGWIEFGDVPARYVAHPNEPISWVPIVQHSKWWQIKLLDVYVGQQSTGYCRKHSCTAVADTGSTDIAVPKSDYLFLSRKIQTRLDCRNTDAIPSLTFVFETDDGKTARLTVPGSQFVMTYKEPHSHRTHCESYLRELPEAFARSNTYVLGMPFLRQYLSVYDFENDRVGFTLANPDPAPAPKVANLMEVDTNKHENSVFELPNTALWQKMKAFF